MVESIDEAITEEIVVDQSQLVSGIRQHGDSIQQQEHVPTEKVKSEAASELKFIKLQASREAQNNLLGFNESESLESTQLKQVSEKIYEKDIKIAGVYSSSISKSKTRKHQVEPSFNKDLDKIYKPMKMIANSALMKRMKTQDMSKSKKLKKVIQSQENIRVSL